MNKYVLYQWWKIIERKIKQHQGIWGCYFIILDGEGLSELRSEEIEGVRHKDIWSKRISGFMLYYLFTYLTAVWTPERACYTYQKKKKKSLVSDFIISILDCCFSLSKDLDLLNTPSLYCPQVLNFPTNFRLGSFAPRSQGR